MSYVAKMTEFCHKVADGTFPAGRLVKLAVRRHEMDLEQGAKRGLRFDEEEAERACRFFPMIKHSTGQFAGKPFELRYFQIFIVCSLFGWRKGDYRRFRQALITFAKGNGKTPLAAALGNYIAFCDGEARAEGYFYATKRDQAKQAFDEAVRQSKSFPLLASQCVQYKLNLDGPNNSFLRPMGSETHDDGMVPHFMCMDEIHRWKDQHRNIYDVLTASLGKRKQPMLIKITTAGDENSHILKEELSAAERTLEQVETNPETWFGDDEFAYIAALDPQDDIHDPANWAKANPMFLEPDGPVEIQALEAMSVKARVDVAAEIKFRRLHCNQMVSSLSKPIRAEVWAKGNDPLPDMHARPVWVGFDSANVNDFAAVTMICQLENGKIGMQSWAWTVEERNEKLQSAEFLNVLNCPNVFVHSGNQIEVVQIYDFIRKLNKEYDVEAWAYDEWRARLMAEHLFETDYINFKPQKQTTVAFHEPLETFLREVAAENVVHGGCPLLAWCASNLVVKTNADGLMRPDKDKSVNKIDPIVAGLMAYREMLFGATLEAQVF